MHLYIPLTYFKYILPPKAKKSSVFLIENINHKVKISRKGNPYKIRYIDICRYSTDFIEFKNHVYNQKPQQKQPCKRKKKCTKIKENNTPEKVDGKLNHICSYCRKRIFSVFSPLYYYACKRYSHECIKNCPHNGKQNRRRCKRRLCNFFINIHVAHCQKSAECAYCKSKSYTPKICFRFGFHKITPCIFYATRQTKIPFSMFSDLSKKLLLFLSFIFIMYCSKQRITKEENTWGYLKLPSWHL